MPPKRAKTKPKTKRKQRGGSKLSEFLPEFGNAILQENKALSLVVNEIKKDPDVLLRVYEMDKARRAGQPKTFEVHPFFGMVGTGINDKLNMALDILEKDNNADIFAKNLKKSLNGYFGHKTPRYLPSYGVLY